jgi:HAD superfamily hydrolase (TIGR01549 family)
MVTQGRKSNQQRHISTIFFDLDGTVLYLDPPGSETFHSYAKEMGVPVTANDARRAERWINRYWAQSQELIEDTSRFGTRDNNGAFWRNHARRHLNVLGINGSGAEDLAARITERMFDEYRPKEHVPDEVYETLGALKKRGYFIGMVSNRKAPLQDVLLEFGLTDIFEIASAAGEIGYWKPDPRILTSVASDAGLKPQEMAYVGDNFYADVGAARAAGITPILLDPKGLFPQVNSLVVRQFADIQRIFGIESMP